jgi:uncharacterized SAM-binding protein YcdF (DUF218 family)
LYVLAFVGACLLVITLTPVVPSIVGVTEPEWFDGQADVLVVLGGSMLIPGPGPRATLGYDTYLRCTFALWILQERKFQYVVVTGGGGLGETMGRFLVQNGIDSRKILVERSAGSTYENALFTRRILQTQYGGKLPRVAVLTSDYHAWRARLTFRHCGFNDAQAIPAPDVIKRSSERTFRLTGAEYLLSEWAKDVFYALSGKS